MVVMFETKYLRTKAYFVIMFTSIMEVEVFRKIPVLRVYQVPDIVKEIKEDRTVRRACAYTYWRKPIKELKINLCTGFLPFHKSVT